MSDETQESAANPDARKAPCPFGEEFEIYWRMRYEQFSRFDEGIQTDDVGLRSACPERAAQEIASILKGEVVLDPFCGIGGISIALARSGKKVIANDRESERLDMAAANARVYGVEDRITFVQGDALDFISSHQADAVFLDPPWGGPTYHQKKVFEFSDFTPDGLMLLKAAANVGSQMALRVPYNFNFMHFRQLQASCYVHWFRNKWNARFATLFFHTGPPSRQTEAE